MLCKCKCVFFSCFRFCFFTTGPSKTPIQQQQRPSIKRADLIGKKKKKYSIRWPILFFNQPKRDLEYLNEKGDLFSVKLFTYISRWLIELEKTKQKNSQPCKKRHDTISSQSEIIIYKKS